MNIESINEHFDSQSLFYVPQSPILTSPHAKLERPTYYHSLKNQMSKNPQYDEFFRQLSVKEYKIKKLNEKLKSYEKDLSDYKDQIKGLEFCVGFFKGKIQQQIQKNKNIESQMANLNQRLKSCIAKINDFLAFGGQTLQSHQIASLGLNSSSQSLSEVCHFHESQKLLDNLDSNIHKIINSNISRRTQGIPQKQKPKKEKQNLLLEQKLHLMDIQAQKDSFILPNFSKQVIENEFHFQKSQKAAQKHENNKITASNRLTASGMSNVNKKHYFMKKQNDLQSTQDYENEIKDLLKQREMTQNLLWESQKDKNSLLNQIYSICLKQFNLNLQKMSKQEIYRLICHLFTRVKDLQKDKTELKSELNMTLTRQNQKYGQLLSKVNESKKCFSVSQGTFERSL